MHSANSEHPTKGGGRGGRLYTQSKRVLKLPGSGQNIQKITMCHHGCHDNGFMATPALFRCISHYRIGDIFDLSLLLNDLGIDRVLCQSNCITKIAEKGENYIISQINICMIPEIMFKKLSTEQNENNQIVNNRMVKVYQKLLWSSCGQ